MSIEPDTKDWTWVLDHPLRRLRLRRPRAVAGPRPAGDPRQRDPVGGGARHRRRRRPAVAARLVAAGVRLPRPRREPPLPHPAAADAGRGRRHGSPTGTRTRPRSRTTTARRTRRSSPREVVEAADAVAERVRRRWPATSGSAAAPAATATGSPSTPSPATTCTTWCTTPTTSRHITKRVTVASYDAHAEEYREGTQQMPDGRPRRDGALRRAAAGGRPGARDRQRPRPRRPGAGAGRPVACGVPTSPRPSSPCCAPTASRPTSSTRSSTTWPTRAAGRAVRRGLGGARPCCTCAARTSRGAGEPRRGDPVRRPAPPVGEGGRRRPVLDPRRRRRAATLHVLARGVRCAPCSTRPAGRWSRSTAPPALARRDWLDVLARRR